MMNVLQPIAYDVLQYLTNLFDYYLYAVSSCNNVIISTMIF